MYESNPREEAYLAYLAFLQEGTFLSLQQSPLAREIAYGTCRRALTLEWIAKELSHQKLPKKKKERTLLYTALYQFYFMEKAPLYALVDETVAIAKRHCHVSFASYLNALLRNLKPLDFPDDLSILYSYPPFFVQLLCEEQGKERAVEIMEVMNGNAPTMVRIRGEEPKGVKKIVDTPFPVGIVEEVDLIPTLGQSPNVYIQNVTPATLMGLLSEGFASPKRVLDLCASPGGKLLAVHDLYPDASLFANDVSENKLKRLRENLDKYGIKATLSCAFGEEFTSEVPFDLIILDVPCSNTGVLHKRPEARWRLSQEAIDAHAKLQKRILHHAKEWLTPQGEIWYLTCSILQEENEHVIESAGLKVRKKILHLPNREGWDGGFGSAVQINHSFH